MAFWFAGAVLLLDICIYLTLNSCYPCPCRESAVRQNVKRVCQNEKAEEGSRWLYRLTKFLHEHLGLPWEPSTNSQRAWCGAEQPCAIPSEEHQAAEECRLLTPRGKLLYRGRRMRQGWLLRSFRVNTKTRERSRRGGGQPWIQGQSINISEVPVYLVDFFLHRMVSETSKRIKFGWSLGTC